MMRVFSADPSLRFAPFRMTVYSVQLHKRDCHPEEALSHFAHRVKLCADEWICGETLFLSADPSLHFARDDKKKLSPPTLHCHPAAGRIFTVMLLL